MKIFKIIIIFVLTFMTILNPITTLASHHHSSSSSSDMIIFDDDFWKGDNYKKDKYQKKAKKIKEYQKKYVETSSMEKEDKKSKKSSKSKSKSHSKSKDNIKIKIDTHKNRIYLYEKINGEWIKIKSEKCCTGAKDTPTPKGTFKAKSKEKTFVNNGKNYNYVTYFEGKCAIHSTPYEDNKYHNSSLGHSRSHGCVRVKPETAKWIYENIEKGTTIEIE